MGESNDAFRPGAGIPEEHVLALAWNIATDPKIHRKVIANPYSILSQQYFAKRFPDEKTPDVIAAVVLAEPEGAYDWQYTQLPSEQQAKETDEQQMLFFRMEKRIAECANTYRHEFVQLPIEYVYASLSLAAFQTADGKLIEQTLSQRVRRDVRLSIIRTIADVSHRATLSTDNKYDSLDKQKAGRRWYPRMMTIGVLSVVVLSAVYMGARWQQDAVSLTVPAETSADSVLAAQDRNNGASAPVRLMIPKINVDAAVQHVSSTPEGTMGVPDNFVDVGWYKLGPRPGEQGSAVIAGHLNGTSGDAAVFADIHKLSAGDAIVIQDGNGMSVTFIVRESRMYDPGYAEAVFSNSEGNHLNLITCDGVWDEAANEYSKRLVVFADLYK